MEGSEQVVEDPLFREINLHDEEQESIDDSPPPYESVIRESPKETRDDGGEVGGSRLYGNEGDEAETLQLRGTVWK